MFDLENFLFPLPLDEPKYSAIILAFRICFGVLMMRHGIQKWMNFNTLKTSFLDPLGIGITSSLVLAIFGELFCAFGFMIGFLYRLCMIPMMFTMFVAGFIALRKAPFDQKELSIVYLITFILLYILGPGMYSIDYLFAMNIY